MTNLAAQNRDHKISKPNPKYVACFADSYEEAREKFISTARAAGAVLTKFENPNGKSRYGEPVYTDIAYFGAEDADHILVAFSGTHGVEGFCGSGGQIALMRSGLFNNASAQKIGIVMVHAINPHGFAHERRVTEDNVDLNRNFQDFSTPLPRYELYDAVHPFLLPEDWDGAGRAEMDRQIAAFIEQRGVATYQAAITGGQYHHSNGLYYGGVAPTWSHRMIRKIIQTYLQGKKSVAFIDFHTGLGPYGYGEPIHLGNIDTKAYKTSLAWWGNDVTSPYDGSSTSAHNAGTIPTAFVQDLSPETTFGYIALEYGTVAIQPVLESLIADNWLYAVGGGDIESPIGRTIKAQIRHAFYQEQDDWKTMVAERAEDITEKALKGMLS